MAATNQDYYSVLGVDRRATDDDIRRAYRRLARQHHPDVNKGNRASEQRFKAVNEAYHVLGDAGRRRDYDEFGSNWQHAEQLRSGSSSPFGGRRGHRGGFSNFDSNSGDGGFSFSQLFGFGGAPKQTTNDVQVEITLEEAFSGAERQVRLNTASGQPRSIVVKIPAGISDGGKVKISPSGVAPLNIGVKVADHPTFERVGDDVKVEISAPFHVPVLGGTARFRTLDGNTELSIPAGTQNGATFRLSGKGMPRLRGTGRGDLIAKLKVTLPTTLSPEGRELYERLRELHE